MRTILSSLRGRFLVAIMLWVALGTAAIWFSTVRLFADHVELHYNKELHVHLDELAALTELDARGAPFLARPLSDPRFAVPLSGFYWQITRDGHEPVRSASMTRGSLDDQIAHKAGIDHRMESGPTGPIIAYGTLRATKSSRELVHFVIATDQRHLDETIDEFSKGLALWLSALAFALVASGGAIITFGLRPLKRLGLAVSRLRSGDSMKLDGPFPEEIAPLVSDLNSYAERTSAIVERGRVQAGNLAHALRTPLAIVTDEAERLSKKDWSSANAIILLDQAEQMRRQISYHLARARSGGSHVAIGAHANLGDVLPPLVSAIQRLYPNKKFNAPDISARAIPVACDPEDVSEIVSNLLDNAGKWAKSTIHIMCTDHTDHYEITVTDDGAGLSDEHLESAFDIGTSYDPGPDSAGLGLAIARDLARDYRGDLCLTNGQSGGVRATLRLPMLISHDKSVQ
jgi:signal transduction histidine kinase